MKRPSTDTARSQNERFRVVRFLSAGAVTPRPAARAGMVLLDGGERGTISASTATLASLRREGVLREEKGRFVLSAEGDALARRESVAEEPFRAQHLELGTEKVFAEGRQWTVCVNLSESPLAQLARRRTRGGVPFLEEKEFRAGERLRADYTRGQIMARVSANWSEPVSSGRRGGNENRIAELTDAALGARQRVDRALTAVGPELAGVLVDVCCFLKGLEQVEAERGWPIRSAKVVLKTALAALSRHYEPEAARGRRSILHWGAQDYRPSLR